MPHIILEYSGNLGDGSGPSRLLDQLHDAVGETESFEADRVKSRAIRCDTYRVGADRSGFVHVTVVFSPGRPEALRRALVNRLLRILRREVETLNPGIATSVEIRQFEPGMYVTQRDQS